MLPALSEGYAMVALSYKYLHFGYWAYDMVVDIKDGFDWVVSEGLKHGLDPSSVLFIGYSAGAHLALLSSSFINELYPGRVKVVINISGPTEILWLYRNHGANEAFYKLSNITGKDDPDFEAKLRWICPSSYLKDVNFTILTIHGINDMLLPHAMNLMFHKKLGELKIPQLFNINDVNGSWGYNKHSVYNTHFGAMGS
jgi:acetyl esterase/lipase